MLQDLFYFLGSLSRQEAQGALEQTRESPSELAHLKESIKWRDRKLKENADQYVRQRQTIELLRLSIEAGSLEFSSRVAQLEATLREEKKSRVEQTEQRVAAESETTELAKTVLELGQKWARAEEKLESSRRQVDTLQDLLHRACSGRSGT